ncbi:MAG TPA: SRPBCC family protein [Woeseiaceae bacterium]|nr:SRPBCC family protein [Woeseiaceae bacterium]
MGIARKILYAAGAGALLFLLVGVFLPSNVHVSRQASIDAPAATVFALLSDARRRQEWSPWISRPGDSEVSFSGPRRGRGASLQWHSPTGGSGRQTILEARPFQSVMTETELDGGRSFVSNFRVEETGDATVVSVTVDIDVGMNLFQRYIRSILADRLTRNHDRGLADLRSLAENLPRADFSDLALEHLMVESIPMAFVTTSSEPNAVAISEAMAAAFFQVLRFIDRQGLTEAGAPLSISRDFSGSRLVFDAAIPVRGIDGSLPPSADGVNIRQSYGGPAVRVIHVGSYADLSRTHRKIAAYLAAYGIERNGNAWESYESDPARTPESELRTHVYYPVREEPAGGAPPMEVSATRGSL